MKITEGTIKRNSFLRNFLEEKWKYISKIIDLSDLYKVDIQNIKNIGPSEKIILYRFGEKAMDFTIDIADDRKILEIYKESKAERDDAFYNIYIIDNDKSQTIESYLVETRISI